MSRILISVEGQTEETFVREIVSPHLSEYDVYPTPVILTTKIVKSGPNFKGWSNIVPSGQKGNLAAIK